MILVLLTILISGKYVQPEGVYTGGSCNTVAQFDYLHRNDEESVWRIKVEGLRSEEKHIITHSYNYK